MRVMPANNCKAIVHYWGGRYPGALGHLYGPGAFRGPFAWLPFALDNGAYAAFTNGTAFDSAAWVALLDKVERTGETPLWALVPDVVGDRDATLRAWEQWSPVAARYGWPLAFAVQDGMTKGDVPDADVIFVGGSTRWKRRTMASPSLGGEVDAWQREKAASGRGAGQAPTYRKQLETLFPEIAAGTFTLAVFTRRELWARIDRLDVDHPTKNRYRAAASSFAKHLVKRERIERNFVRDIDGFGENDPRLVYYEIADAKRIIGAMVQPYAAISAAALGFCMEWGALDRARVGDFDLKASPVITHVRGTKRAWRDRRVPLVPELDWVLEFIRPALADKLPTARAFDGVPEWRAIDEQRAAADALEIHAVGEAEFGQHSIHDWRHTHAVALLRWGYSEQIAANHEGHKNTTLVRERYGRFLPTAFDYAKPKAPAAKPRKPKVAK